MILDYGVGAITESDLADAQNTGAIILGFDVPYHPLLESAAVD